MSCPRQSLPTPVCTCRLSVSLVYGEPSSFSLCFPFLVEWCFCVLFFILILFLRFSVIPHSMWDLKFLDQGLNLRALRWKAES